MCVCVCVRVKPEAALKVEAGDGREAVDIVAVRGDFGDEKVEHNLDKEEGVDEQVDLECGGLVAVGHVPEEAEQNRRGDSGVDQTHGGDRVDHQAEGRVRVQEFRGVAARVLQVADPEDPPHEAPHAPARARGWSEGSNFGSSSL